MNTVVVVSVVLLLVGLAFAVLSTTNAPQSLASSFFPQTKGYSDTAAAAKATANSIRTDSVSDESDVQIDPEEDDDSDDDEDDDEIEEMKIDVDNDQFRHFDRDAYVQYDHPQYGFTAPIVGGTAYLSRSNGYLPSAGIPVRVFTNALRNGNVYFYSSVYDPLGRTLYDSPLKFSYRTGRYLRRYPSYRGVHSYPWRRRYATAYSKTRSYVPYRRFKRFRGRRRFLPSRGAYGKYQIGGYRGGRRGRRGRRGGSRGRQPGRRSGAGRQRSTRTRRR